MATNADANALGYITPADNDLIADGNEAISTNARVSTQLSTAAATALAATTDRVDALEDRYLHGITNPDASTHANGGALYVNTDAQHQTGAWLWQNRGSFNAPDWHVISGDTGEVTRSSWDTAGVVTGEPLPAGLSPTPGTAGRVTMRRTDQMAQIGIYGATWTGRVGGWTGFYEPAGGLDLIAGTAVDNTFQTLRITQVGTVFRLGTAGLEADPQFGLMFTYPAATTWPA